MPKLANTQPDRANIGLLMVVSRVPKMIMRAGDRMSANVPLKDLEALDKNCAMACKLPICMHKQQLVQVEEVGVQAAEAPSLWHSTFVLLSFSSSDKYKGR